VDFSLKRQYYILKGKSAIDVSILVLVDFSLTCVSILVLVDFSLKLGRPRGSVVRGWLVSILVLVDFSLKPSCILNSSISCETVSILVLVDFSLKQRKHRREKRKKKGFQSLFWWIFL